MDSWTNFLRISCMNLSTKYEIFAQKIGYVTNGLYCIVSQKPQISQKLDIQTILTIDVNQFVNKRAFHLL